MANLLLITADRVVISDVFDTNRQYLYKDSNPPVTGQDAVFTKVFKPEALRIFQETTEGKALSQYEDERFLLPPSSIPATGPFIEDLCIDGNPNTLNFRNILLLDKPPLRTGFFQFFINDISFTGLITRTSTYDEWHWEQNGYYYGYTKKSGKGYGIEISKNSLYTVETIEIQDVDSTRTEYVYNPTALLLALRNLKGGEEIISTSTPVDPNTYIQPIPGLSSLETFPDGIDLYFISPTDALRYVASYPDLISSIGTNVTRAQQEYARNPKQIIFNPISYLNKYADLRQAFGYDAYAATLHYIQTGYNEGRTYDSASGINYVPGGLYDERTGGFSLASDSLIWANGETIAGKGKSLTYKFGGVSYYLNGNLPVDNKLVFLKVH